MEQFGKVFPPSQFPPKDLPLDHPLYHSVFEIAGGVPQIASIGFWLGSGGGTSERYQDSAQVHARGVYDQSGRMMALFTHNTDIGDSWEEEASNPQYFYEFSTKGYAFGIDAITLVFGVEQFAIDIQELGSDAEDEAGGGIGRSQREHYGGAPRVRCTAFCHDCMRCAASSRSMWGSNTRSTCHWPAISAVSRHRPVVRPAR